MRFLADENVFPKVVSHLIEIGYDVKDSKSSNLLRASDDEIMEFCIKEERTLITFDKHFANILRHPPENTFGIIVIRMHPPILKDVQKVLERFLSGNWPVWEQGPIVKTLKGKLIVLTKKGYRMRGISGFSEAMQIERD